MSNYKRDRKRAEMRSKSPKADERRRNRRIEKKRRAMREALELNR